MHLISPSDEIFSSIIIIIIEHNNKPLQYFCTQITDMNIIIIYYIQNHMTLNADGAVDWQKLGCLKRNF